jgi:glycosyltransferase involved in cell wall biosynthesis
MRIIFLTNYYPPHSAGGQELTCQQVVEGLKLRNHQIRVLTSMYGVGNNPVLEGDIHRSLYLEMDPVPWRHSITFFTSRKNRDQHNQIHLKELISEFKPDIIFIWGMWNLPRSIAALAERECPGKVVYRFGDYWPTLPSQHEIYWNISGRKWYSRLPKKLLGKLAFELLKKDDILPPLEFQHAICISESSHIELLNQGIPLSDVRIIYGGLNVDKFLNVEPSSDKKDVNECLNLVYIGRLSPEKGVDTAILAIDKLINFQERQEIKLTMVGSGPEDCERALKVLVETRNLTKHVTFKGKIPHEDVPECLRSFDIMLVPSTWTEPFGRVILEGMISHLVVIASNTGGPSEVITDGQNGLLFSPGDSYELAQKIESLILDPELLENLANAGYETVLEQFTDTVMIDKMESYLMEVSQA